jgi:hypothetical protein
MAVFYIRAAADTPARGPYQVSKIQGLVDCGRFKSHHQVSKNGEEWFPLGLMKAIRWPTEDGESVDEGDGLLGFLDEAVAESKEAALLATETATETETSKRQVRIRLTFDEWEPVRRGLAWMHTAAVAHYYFALISFVQFAVQVVALVLIITVMAFVALMSSEVGFCAVFMCPLFGVFILAAFFKVVVHGGEAMDALYGGSRGFSPMILEKVGWSQLSLMICVSIVVVVVLPTQAPVLYLSIQGLLVLMVVFGCGCEAISSMIVGIRSPDNRVQALGIGGVLCNLIGLIGVIGAPLLFVVYAVSIYADKADVSLGEFGEVIQRLTGGQPMSLPMISLLIAALLGPAGKAACLSAMFARISEMCGKTEEQKACWDYCKQAVGLCLFRNGLIVAAIVVMSKLGIDGDGAEIIVLVPFLVGAMAMAWFAVSECTMFEERSAAAHDGLLARMR